MESQHVDCSVAVASLVEAWRVDDGFRHGWLANIAIHFQDCAPENWPREETHRVSNEAADRFLRSLENAPRDGSGTTATAYLGPFICGEPREEDPRYRKPVLEEGVEFWRPRGWERVEYEDDLADWVGPGTIWRIPGSDAPSAELLELAGP